MRIFPTQKKIMDAISKKCAGTRPYNCETNSVATRPAGTSGDSIAVVSSGDAPRMT